MVLLHITCTYSSAHRERVTKLLCPSMPWTVRTRDTKSIISAMQGQLRHANLDGRRGKSQEAIRDLRALDRHLDVCIRNVMPAVALGGCLKHHWQCSPCRVKTHCCICLFDMWHLVRILAASQLWFSDGGPLEAARGSQGVSSRLIVDRHGFLDITEVHSSQSMALDANGATLWLKRREMDGGFTCPPLQNSSYPLNLSLQIDHVGGSFTLGLVKVPDIITGWLIPHVLSIARCLYILYMYVCL